MNGVERFRSCFKTVPTSEKNGVPRDVMGASTTTVKIPSKINKRTNPEGREAQRT